MQRNNNYFFMRGMLVLLWSGLMMTAAQAAWPLWTMIPAPGSNPAQTVLENEVATVLYVVQNQSHKPKKLVIQSIPGITQTTPCQLAPIGQAGSSCTLNLAITGSKLPKGGIHGGPSLCQANLDGSPNPNQCYQPSSANSLSITLSLTPGATITVNPTRLLFAEHSIGDVTVTNDTGSLVVAENVAATIPGGSNLSVQSTTCGAVLAIGASCTISVASSVQEGPTTISIAGNNTNTVNVDVTVTSQPQISITSPVQQSRVVAVSGAALSLEITNAVGSVVNANAITVSDKAACPNLSVDDSNCASVAPDDSCMLELSSSTPYAPCTITISGSNTANSPTTLIAFYHLGGLVFQESGGSGKVVTEPLDNPNELSSLWSSQNNNIPTDLDNGDQNTTIIISNDPGCTTVNNCAALRCRDISADWYLPARNELSAVHSALCSNNAIPCNFGEFSSTFYRSSSQQISFNSWLVEFPSGSFFLGGKNFDLLPVRCVLAFAS